VSSEAVARAATPEDLRDLGLGARVTQQSRTRTLNRDGSFNVVREGLSAYQSLAPYHALLSMSWARFYALIAVGYLVANLGFAAAYLLCGPGALHGADPAAGLRERAFDAFFFSVQTLATIGYGRLSPAGLGANLLVALEALVGMLAITMATGLAFARFSRHGARIRYSRQALIAPYRGGRALMFRVINERDTQIVQLQARVLLGRMEAVAGKPTRRFHPLALERSEVLFFPLHWTVVHPIDESSPLYGETPESLRAADAEVLVLLTGVDEASSQTVYSRTAYQFEEIVPNARFADMFLEAEDGKPRVDVRRLDLHEPA
jgi:inward rectifier potassium channel